MYEYEQERSVKIKPITVVERRNLTSILDSVQDPDSDLRARIKVSIESLQDKVSILSCKLSEVERKRDSAERELESLIEFRTLLENLYR